MTEQLIALVVTLGERLDRIEKQLSMNVQKEAYTTDEIAERIGRSEWSVRQFCNKGQIQAKKVHGRGRAGEWRVSSQELLRIQRDGPLVPGSFDNQ